MPSSQHSKDMFSVEFSASRYRGPSPVRTVRRGRASPARPARPLTVWSSRHLSCWPVRRSLPRLSPTRRRWLSRARPVSRRWGRTWQVGTWFLQKRFGIMMKLMLLKTSLPNSPRPSPASGPTCWTRSSLTWRAKPRTPQPRTSLSLIRAIPSPCRKRSLSPLWTSFYQSWTFECCTQECSWGTGHSDTMHSVWFPYRCENSYFELWQMRGSKLEEFCCIIRFTHRISYDQLTWLHNKFLWSYV